jgi:hypothetical protein
LVPEEQLSTVTQYSVSFWYRFGSKDPQHVPLNFLRNQYSGIGGFTELDNYGNLKMKSRGLSIFLAPFSKNK